MTATASPPRPKRPATLGLLRGLIIAAAAGVVLAVSGAFGTAQIPISLRLAYWVPVMLAGALWGHVCSRLVDRWIDMDERPWITVAALSASITGPVSVLVWFVTGLVFEGQVYRVGALPLMVGPVLTVTVVMSAINVFLSKAQPVQTHAAPAGAAPARFPDRLPMKLRGAAIRAVQAEDHYLRIHTDLGHDIILMRMADAVGLLDALPGARVHRSWWVARSAVEGSSSANGRTTLQLATGIEAPVSRSIRPALAALGWFL